MRVLQSILFSMFYCCMVCFSAFLEGYLLKGFFKNECFQCNIVINDLSVSQEKLNFETYLYTVYAVSGAISGPIIS